MTFNVEVVLKGHDFAVTEAITVPHGAPATWQDDSVRDILIEILRAIDRVQNPGAPSDRAVTLQGFSWIVEPIGDEVVIAIEIPMGAAVAGPFAAAEPELTERITRVMKIERQLFGPQTVH